MGFLIKRFSLYRGYFTLFFAFGKGSHGTKPLFLNPIEPNSPPVTYEQGLLAKAGLQFL